MTQERYSTRQAQIALAQRFGLPWDLLMQDWEYEVADPGRYAEFLSAYRRGELDEDERFSLMMILIQCVEDLETEQEQAWAQLELLLRADWRLHRHLVWYWALMDEPDIDLGDAFRLTPSMRALWMELHGIT